MTSHIPFNRPPFLGEELNRIRQAIEAGHLSGNGEFSKSCSEMLRAAMGGSETLLTTSCTSALEMSGLILKLEPGDEVILPSYTFVSTANAFVLRGCTPVFVDIDEDDLCIDPDEVANAITAKTRAIIAVHYAGISCDVDRLIEVADDAGVPIIEDAAQALCATYKKQPLGSFGQLSALSFHETKNIVSGEGGAIIINDPKYLNRAEILWEKGTDRAKFFRGEVDKYTWRDIGSSFLPSEITAAYLSVQLDRRADITADRIRSWNVYHEQLAELEDDGLIIRPKIPSYCQHNGHIYHIRTTNPTRHRPVLTKIRDANIDAVTHYVPLHSSPAGQKFGRPHGSLRVTDAVAQSLIRLPLWYGMTEAQLDRVCSTVKEVVRSAQ